MPNVRYPDRWEYSEVDMVAIRHNQYLDRADSVLVEIGNELQRAIRKHPQSFHSRHEGYAVLLEEVDELWIEVQKQDPAACRKEAVQVAAMALRFLLDCYD